jgi:hypothetical protein
MPAAPFPVDEVASTSSEFVNARPIGRATHRS